MTIDLVVDFLNKALEKDDQLITDVFMEIKVPAKQDVLEDKNIPTTINDELRLLGVLNGVVYNGRDCIIMTINEETQKIIKFSIGRLHAGNSYEARE